MNKYGKNIAKANTKDQPGIQGREIRTKSNRQRHRKSILNPWLQEQFYNIKDVHR